MGLPPLRPAAMAQLLPIGPRGTPPLAEEGVCRELVLRGLKFRDPLSRRQFDLL